MSVHRAGPTMMLLALIVLAGCTREGREDAFGRWCDSNSRCDRQESSRDYCTGNPHCSADRSRLF